VAGIDFETIGSKFPQLAQGISLPTPSFPEISLNSARDLFQPALTIAILCAVESLLAAMVADGATGKKHDSNTELIGQGITNIVTPIFGGIPSTGALARTMANINNGGKSPVAGIVHSVVLLLIFLFLLPYAVYIPLSVLAAILIMVAYNMSEWRSFVSLIKGDKAEASVLLTTFLLTVIVDLTIAIEVGILMAILLFVKRVSETSGIKLINEEVISEMESEESLISHEMLSVPEYTEIYEIEGPFYFGLATKIDEIDSLSHRKIKVRVLRMRRVPFIDSTGLNNLKNLWKRSKKERIHIILSGVNKDVMESLIKSGLAEDIGKENICSDIGEAMQIAKKINSQAKR
jgi:SulP family sulfate permease